MNKTEQALMDYAEEKISVEKLAELLEVNVMVIIDAFTRWNSE